MSGAGRLFGTDGIRARFGAPPLDSATVARLGLALARQLSRSGGARLLVARDTRPSGLDLAAWLRAGLERGGARVEALGVLPTAALARAVVETGADGGVVLSASHNPPEDNGVKLVDARGFKWSAADEGRLEERLATTEEVAVPPPAAAAGESEAERRANAAARAGYLARLRELCGGISFPPGTRVALDAAHGAAAGLARELFSAAGAGVEVLNDEPDGTRINRDGGATRPETLARRISGGDFSFGFAFDGDADRAILVDERGEVRDGDAMLFLWARDLARRGALVPPAIVATSMSNLGLERALARHGVGVVRCGVGDREVVETLRARGLRLGGEQSGHLVDLALATTGDGLLSALVVARLLVAGGLPASESLAEFRRYPPLLRSVRVAAKPRLEELPGIAAAARRVESTLGGDGRLVLRYSGTEPLARIMLEGPDEDLIARLAAELAAAIEREIGVRA